MSNFHPKIGRLVATGALVVMLAATGATAEARGAGARAAGAAGAAQPRRTAAGGNWTRTTETQRTANGHTRSDRWQGANGRTASRDVAVSRDKAAGTSTLRGGYTGFDGKTASVDATRTRTADGMTIDRTVQTPNGRTIEHDVVKSCDRAAGKCTTTVTHEVTPPPAAP